MIFDAHSDILSDITTKYLNGETDVFRRYHYDGIVKGKVEGSIFVIWVEPEYMDNSYARVIKIMDSLKKDYEYSHDILSIVKSYDEMMTAKKENKFYIFIGLEGLENIKDNLDLIDSYYEFGCRHASLTWNEENMLATGAKGRASRGLTSLGKKAVKKINDKKMILDLSHLNDKSFFDVIDATDKPLIASHSNARKLCDASRNLTDEQLKLIRDLNGVVGFNSYSDFIGNDKDSQTLEMCVNHIKYMCDLIGVDHVGLGFDYLDYFEDGVFGDASSYIKGLENSSKSYNIIEYMLNSGFTKEESEKIAYKNFHKIIKTILI
jgi:membrane dipeptidase